MARLGRMSSTCMSSRKSRDDNKQGSTALKYAAGVVAVAASLYASMNSYRIASELHAQSTDPYGVAAAVDRFATVRGMLPPRGTVGYISDLPERVGGTVRMAASYALLPRLVAPVENGSSYEWAVGNFSRPLDYAAAGAQFGYTMAADTGSGVILYRKARH